MKPFLLLLALVVLPSHSFAGGSMPWKDVEKVLTRKPALLKLVKDNFKVAETGSAIRLGRQFKFLGGARIAPYQFTLTATDGTVFHLTVDCEQTFVLADGKPANDEQITGAVRVLEKPTGISINTEPPEGE